MGMGTGTAVWEWEGIKTPHFLISRPQVADNYISQTDGTGNESMIRSRPKP